MNDPVVDALGRAAEALRTFGWTQHVQVDTRHRMCVVGALDLSSPGISLPQAVLEAVHDAIHDADRHATTTFARSDLIDCVVRWNDAPGRTKEEVLDMLQRAALRVQVRNALQHMAERVLDASRERDPVSV